MIKAADYGVVADGLANNTAAMRAAIAASASTGDGDILLPDGVIAVDDVLQVVMPGTIIHGSGRGRCTIKTTHPSRNILELVGWDTEARQLSFESGVTRTGGVSVKLTGVRSRIRDFMVNHDFIGIHMSGVASRIEDGVMTTGTQYGTRVLVDGGDVSQIIDRLLIGAQDGPMPDYGIKVTHNMALIISNTSVLTAGICLGIVPDNGQGVHSLYAHHCFFDSSKIGVLIAPVNMGNVSRIKLDQCWTGGHVQNGVDIRRTGSGDCSGIHLNNHDSLNNGLSGVSVGPGVTDFTINGGQFAGNAHGVYMAQGCTDWSILNATIGRGAGMVPNRGWGVLAENYCNRYLVAGNRMVDNGSGSTTAMNNQFGQVYGNI
ncbi:hypothetical protein [Herbaspirillum frisingense]|uniref:hypothetical protein n=1 Tax=Herbaspirillum frisingense TaxID=92645 RepID=UPI0039AF8BFB